MSFTDILYCQTCGARVPPADVLSGAALVLPEENKVYCKACTPPAASVHDAPTETDLRPLDPSRDLLETIPVRKNDRRSSRSLIPAQRTPNAERPAPKPSKAPLMALAAAGGMAVLAGAIFFFSSHKGTTGKAKTDTDTSTEVVVDTSKKIDAPKFADSKSPIQPWAPVCVIPLEYLDETPEAQRSWLLRRAQALYGPLILWPDAPAPEEVASVSPVVAPPANPNEVVLAKIALDGFNGGRVLKDLLKKGTDGKTLYGQKTPEATSTARFDLKLPTSGNATVLLNTIRLNAEPCTYSVGLNGHEIFQGAETGKEKEWTVQTVAVPAGILQAGRNELRVVNLDPSGNYGAPQIIVGGAEIRGNPLAAPVLARVEPKTPPKVTPAAPAEPAFPPLMDAQQRSTLQFINNVFVPLSKYDLETAQRLAATDTTASGKQLTGVLAGAQTVFNKASAAVNKSTTPLTVQASAGRLNMSGQVTRIEGGKAWVKDRGLEVSVELSALPPELFVKALAANDTTPDGRLDKALLNIALGNIPAAAQLMKKAGTHAPSAELVAMFNQYSQLTAMLKFETDLNEIAATIKDAPAPEAVVKLKALQQSNPEFAKLQKERITYLLSKAEKK